MEGHKTSSTSEHRHYKSDSREKPSSWGVSLRSFLPSRSKSALGIALAAATTAFAVPKAVGYAHENWPILTIDNEKLSRHDLIELAYSDPRKVLAHANEILEPGGGENVIYAAALEDPGDAIAFAPHFVGKLPEKERASFVLNLIKDDGMNPEAVAAFFAKEQKNEGGELLLDLVAQRMSEKTSLSLNYAKALSLLPKGKEYIRHAYAQADDLDRVIHAAQYGPLDMEAEVRAAFEKVSSKPHAIVVLKSAAPYANAPWMRAVMERAAEHSSTASVTESYENFKHVPGAQEVLYRALENSLSSEYDDILSSYPQWKDLPGASNQLERVVREAARDEYRANSILKKADVFLGEPWGPAVTRELVQSATSIESYKTWKSLPDADSLLEELAERDIKSYPFEIFQHAEQLKHLPNVLDLITRAAENNPNEAISYFQDYQFVPGSERVLQISTQRLLAQDTRSLLEHGKIYKGHRWAEPLLQQAIDRDPAAFIRSAPTLKWLPNFDARLKQAATKALSTNAEDLFHYFSSLEDQDSDWQESLLIQGVDRYPTLVLTYLEDHGEKFSGDLVQRALEATLVTDPESVFQKWNSSGIKSHRPDARLLQQAAERMLQSAPEIILNDYETFYKAGLDDGWIKKTLIKAVSEDPTRLIYDFSPRRGLQAHDLNDKLYQALASSHDPRISRLLTLINRQTSQSVDDYDTFRKIVPLLINNPGLSEAQARHVAADSDRYFRYLAAHVNDPNSIAHAAMNHLLKQHSLEAVRQLNELHEAPDSKRFASVEKLSAAELYELMVYGEEELFTSSYNGVFNRLLKKMEEQKLSGDTLLQQVHGNEFRTFFKLASRYNRLNDFLSTMPKKESDRLLHGFVSNIEESSDPLREATSIADTFSAISDPALIATLQSAIKSEYEKAVSGGNGQAEAMYGLLAGIFGDRSAVDKTWLSEVTAKYHLDHVTELPTSELFGPDGSNIQQYYFYDDSDGKSSFLSFMQRMKDGSKWRVEDGDHYVHAVSVNGGDKKIEIFANKPTNHEGVDEIAGVLKKRHATASVIVHRGHSYHTSETLRELNSSARIVFLGSCGGYGNITTILEKAPTAHIISTKGTGTMMVNDPLLSIVNDHILADQDLKWQPIWDEAQQKLGKNENFHNYIAPHQNLGVLFIKAYRAQVRTHKQPTHGWNIPFLHGILD